MVDYFVVCVCVCVSPYSIIDKVNLKVRIYLQFAPLDLDSYISIINFNHTFHENHNFYQLSTTFFIDFY